jgi:hypothetical protein
MPTGKNPPLIFQIAVNNQGAPVPGAALYHYVTNTTVPKDIFADFELTTPLPQPLVADAEGRYEQYFLEDGQYTFVEYDAPLPAGVQLRPPAHHIEGATIDGGAYTLPVATDETLGGVKGGGDVVIGEDGTMTVDYENIPGPDLSLLPSGDLVVKQLSGVGSSLLRIPTDFEWAGWTSGFSTDGGRGISPGYAWFGEPGSQTHRRVWGANDAWANIYWSTDNWASSVHDTSLTGIVGPSANGRRPPCMKYAVVDGVASWVVTEDDSAGSWRYAEDIAANYNANGALKPAAWQFGTAAPHLIADIGQGLVATCVVGNHGYITRTLDWVTWTDVYTGSNVIGGIDTDGYGNWVAVERDTGVVIFSDDDGLTWTNPTIYTRASEDAPYVSAASVIPTGAVVHANGVWLLLGAASYAYSEDGINWTTQASALGSFYGVGFDGVRIYATNPDDGDDPAVIYQLLASSIPAHRQIVHEKGFVSNGPDWLPYMPGATAIGTDSMGRKVRRDVTISEDAPVDAPGATDWIWFVVDPL